MERPREEAGLMSRCHLGFSLYGELACRPLTSRPVFVVQSHGILHETGRFALDDRHHLAWNIL